MKSEQNYINHIALVLDASGSMYNLSKDVIKVADEQIKHLALRSKELDQETRATVYTFSDRQVDCIFYDKDVLRMPSIADHYKIGGATNLIDATLKSMADLAMTPELYGEHAFLIYVMTDGEENASQAKPAALVKALETLKDHWTVAVFVPNQKGVFEAKAFGFPKDNIAVWSTDSKGISEVGRTIRVATDNFMTGRASGVRGYRNLFKMDTTNLTAKAIQKLDKLGPGQFRMFKVDFEGQIADFVEGKLHRPYKLGEAYYQLTKPVKVQPQKQIAIYDRKAHAVYTGKDARTLLGLPVGFEVKVAPESHPNYEIFVQSTSVNRKLFGGTNLLLIS